MILTVPEMQAIEQEAFQSGIEAAELMEEAGLGIARAVQQFFPTPKTVIAYCGKGNNGGDALVAARILAQDGWKILVQLTVSKNEMSLLAQSHLQELEKRYQISALEKRFHINEKSCIILDGLLGIGTMGAPQGSIKEAIDEIKTLHREQQAFVVAIDLPSGLDGTTGVPFESCVEADLTVTIAFAKAGLLADTATNQVGRLAVVSLASLNLNKLKAPQEETSSLLLSEGLSSLLPPRAFDVHKGTFGHVGILAGSYGYLGAARLASAAALHAGAGTVTLYALPDIYELLATSVQEEVMVKPIKQYTDLFAEPLQGLAIGPGLGSKHHDEILELIEKLPIPCVVDADALNALSQEMSRLLKIQGPRLLTPHPGEMERLFPAEKRDRTSWAKDFIKQYHVTLLLKGARTIIAEQAKPLLYNTTGNPGMSSGGMGDVLTGVAVAFLAGGHSCHEAAQLAAWLCGRSAEIAIYEGEASSESLTANDIIDHLGRAIRSLRTGDY